METIIGYISERLNTLLTEKKSNIAIIGFVGSLSPKSDSGDIDIFSFLSDSIDITNDNLLKKHRELISSIKIIQDELKQKSVALNVFTEFRLEEFSRFTAIKYDEYKNFLLHLKVYPNPPSILDWQQRAITYNYFSNISRIVYKTINEANLLNYLKESIPKPKLHEKVDFLRMLIYEMTEYIELGNLPKELKYFEIKNKLNYISDYLINYLFEYEENRLKGTNINEKRKILTYRKKINEIKANINLLNENNISDILDQYFEVIEKIHLEIIKL